MLVSPDYLLCFYVPVEHAEFVKKAVFATGAGKIGNYEYCAWQTAGQGQFRPIHGANPTVGELDALSTVKELKVELVCEAGCIQGAVKALKRAHPYETPAYHVVKFESGF